VDFSSTKFGEAESFNIQGVGICILRYSKLGLVFLYNCKKLYGHLSRKFNQKIEAILMLYGISSDLFWGVREILS
jgi:hypothetical protein